LKLRTTEIFPDEKYNSFVAGTYRGQRPTKGGSPTIQGR